MGRRYTRDYITLEREQAKKFGQEFDQFVLESADRGVHSMLDANTTSAKQYQSMLYTLILFRQLLSL